MDIKEKVHTNIDEKSSQTEDSASEWTAPSVARKLGVVMINIPILMPAA